jgi:hypothetical protein
MVGTLKYALVEVTLVGTWISPSLWMAVSVFKLTLLSTVHPKSIPFVA